MIKKVGLALGAGGAKGLAHIGVLQVLNQNNIKIDYVAGASMGAIVGAAFAAGADMDFLAKLAMSLNQTHIFDVTMPRIGLLKGDKAQEIIKLITHNKTFSELDVPLAVVATDIETGKRVTFQEGDLTLAVRASMSVPGIFNPIRFNNMLLVDGAVVGRLPVDVLKEMGAEFIIAVDVKSWPSGRHEVNNIYEIIMQSIDILENEACKTNLNLADIIITPDVTGISVADFRRARECIEAGRKAAENKIEEIITALQETA